MATITSRTPGKYQVKVRRQGYPTQSKTFSSKKLAQQWARKIESEMEQGVFLDLKLARNTTLSQLMLRYEAEILPDKRSQQPIRSLICTLNAEIGHYNLVNLTPRLLSEHRDKRLQSVSPETARKDLLFLQCLFNTASKEWGINLPLGNPVSKVTLPRRPRSRNRRATVSEIRLLCSDQTVGDLVTFAIETGMRRGEISSMEWQHINWASQTLSIPITKTNMPRTIPISNRALETLRGLPRRLDGRVWGIRPDSITQAFQRACKRTGIENLRFHDLRHEATSRFFEMGLSIMEVSAITGHQDLRMLKRYTHIRPETLVNKLQNYHKEELA
ncbi:MAG: site-specific integrase [Candidatus Thiodiazotropha sp. (ex Myrtea sp. 'scaly one' KF741663)]|nr:site-specific integrase [Candidatus Thiodiazotropha sp. (ex Myrtea sp. 'scaly one' KF741663)]